MPGAAPRHNRHAGFLRGAALAIVLSAITGSGCGPRQDAAAPRLAPRPGGYVYVAQLLPEHPLYPQLQALEGEIARLAAVPMPATIAFAGAPAMRLEVGPLLTPGMPLETFLRRRADWLQGPSLLAPPGSSPLAPDLAAELNWTRQRLADAMEQAARQAASDEALRLSAQRAAAVRARQEMLNNAGLDLSLSEAEAQAAGDAERQRLWDEIDQEMHAAGAASEARLGQLRQELEADTARLQAEAEARIWQRQEERLGIAVKSGSKTRTAMSNSVKPPEPLEASAAESWVLAEARGARIIAGRQQLGVVAQTRRNAQISELQRRRAALAGRLMTSTEHAVVGLAAMQGLELSLPPRDEPRGPNRTEEMRQALRKLYAGE